ncbi:hypothetical protein ACFXPZ_14115 [Streptomyces sp. NPDC059101]|uniref:hypothetical protein n=1 Tax=Streptomyces sp. NPDC059101 TaxID=3346728 RepID=UPI0036A80E63
MTARAWAREREWEGVRAWQAVVAARAEAAAARPEGNVDVAVAAPVPVVVPAPRPAAVAAKPEPELKPEVEDIDDDQELLLEDLTRDQVLDWRARAAADHQVVLDHIERYGEHSAQRLFTRALVATVQRLSGLEHLEGAQ